MSIDTSEMRPFIRTLVGFAGEHVKVLEHIPMVIMFKSGDNAKSVKVRYLIVNALSPYNIIIRRPYFNAFETVLSILYLTMYPLCGRGIRVIKGEHELAP